MSTKLWKRLCKIVQKFEKNCGIFFWKKCGKICRKDCVTNFGKKWGKIIKKIGKNCAKIVEKNCANAKAMSNWSEQCALKTRRLSKCLYVLLLNKTFYHFQIFPGAIMISTVQKLIRSPIQLLFNNDMI